MEEKFAYVQAYILRRAFFASTVSKMKEALIFWSTVRRVNSSDEVFRTRRGVEGLVLVRGQERLPWKDALWLSEGQGLPAVPLLSMRRIPHTTPAWAVEGGGSFSFIDWAPSLCRYL